MVETTFAGILAWLVGRMALLTSLLRRTVAQAPQHRPRRALRMAALLTLSAALLLSGVAGLGPAQPRSASAAPLTQAPGHPQFAPAPPTPATYPCRIAGPARLPATFDRIDQAIAVGISALTTGGQAQIDRAIELFNTAFNSAARDDPRRQEALDNLGCAYLKKAQLGFPAQNTDWRISASRRALTLAEIDPLLPVEATGVPCPFALGYQQAAQRLLTEQHDMPPALLPDSYCPSTHPLGPAEAIDVQLQVATYDWPVLESASPRGPPALLLYDELDGNQVEELVWVYVNGVLKAMIHLYDDSPADRQLADVVSLPVERCGSYRVAVEVMTYYNQAGPSDVLDRPRTAEWDINVCENTAFKLVTCGPDESQVWIEPLEKRNWCGATP